MANSRSLLFAALMTLALAVTATAAAKTVDCQRWFARWFMDLLPSFLPLEIPDQFFSLANIVNRKFARFCQVSHDWLRQWRT